MKHSPVRHSAVLAVGLAIYGAIGISPLVTAQSPVTYQEIARAADRQLPRLTAQPVTLPNQTAPIASAVFAGDGVAVTTVDAKGNVVRWELAAGGNHKSILNLDADLTCAALSQDARQLAYANHDGSANLLDLVTGDRRPLVVSTTTRLVSLAFSPWGNILAGASDTGEVTLWDTNRGEVVRQFSVEPNSVQTLAFSFAERKQLAVGSFSSTVRMFDLTSQSKPHELDVGDSRVTALAYSRDGRNLVVACADGTTRVYDLDRRAPQVQLGSRVFAVWRLAFDDRGERLATASWDGTIRLWDASTWKLLETHKAHDESLSAMVFGPRGDLVSASVTGPLKHWALAAPRLQATGMIAGRKDSAWVALYSPNGKTMFVGGREKRFELWDLESHQLLVAREGHPTTRCAAFSPDGKTLVTGGDDGRVIWWNARTGDRESESVRHRGAVSAVAFTPNGDTLVSACDGGEVKRWDVTTGKETASWHEHKHQIYCAAISPDGKWLLTGGGDWTSDARGELIIWDLATGRVRASLDGHRLAVWAIAFTPDGKQFATTCSSGEVKIWDWERLTDVTTLQNETWVRALDYSPDGGTLAVGVGNGSVRLWDSATWREIAALEGHKTFTFFLQFAPDGNRIVTAGEDGTVRFWPTSP